MVRVALGILVCLSGLLVPAPASAARPDQPAHIQGTRTVPAYDYADAIRESVWVRTSRDDDGDGERDTIAVDIIRPRGVDGRVPVIMDPSPYYLCCGRGNEPEYKEYDADGTATRFPLFYDNYFVPRGYAYAAVDLAGTGRSTGCADVGGPGEILGTKAVIDWLNGRASATDADGNRVRATWTTGKVGLIGKSWDGTVANGVAATGVEGLETIVPIAGITSWYDYFRDNGALYTTEFGPSWLSSHVDGRPPAACQAVRDALAAGAADDTGDYNSFWHQRNYQPDASKVRASVFLVHGLNDVNVETKHLLPWWEALGRHRVPRKLWLAQPGHVDPFDYRRAEWVDTLHRWFDHWLQDLPNGVQREQPVSIERSPDTWVDEPAWPARGTVGLPVSLRGGTGGAGTLGLLPGRGTVSLTDDPGLGEHPAVAEPNAPVPGRLVFLTAPLARDLRISGAATVSLRIRANRPNTELSARLVDYGDATRIHAFTHGVGIRNLDTRSCWGQASATDHACYLDTAKNLLTSGYGVLTRGWVDAAHRDSLTRPTPLRPGRWHTVTWDLNPHDAVLPKGRVLGLVITLSDPDFTLPTNTGATVDVDLARSRLALPVVLGHRGAALPGTVLPETAVAPRVAAPETAGDPADVRWRDHP
ncbi:Xaa-Pro dipeptidyl-peptidase [Actinophytocola xinjiangensis]|uniref:Xaa-Pro dipeptidyl-peptidase n=1 Tax=Actinophytocola xinjiangensis TaxID=485602 RepID=A0A7Z1AUH8_9PSEU|nr:Xaa-Pro dipeptidyl-peptidase [Actinophytocola xinjiangensis]OLF05595.1 Xaa-Pro dipeptidyl-peptidase [Actinophytocola xinjiangensis]